MIVATLPIRVADDFGYGSFGSPRGNKTHRGIDYLCYPGTTINSPVSGTVTKLGYCYTSDLSYRYVEVTDGAMAKHRLFYVHPDVKDGQNVTKGYPVGTAQDISAKHSTKDKIMGNHVHYEIIVDGKYINPDEFGI